MYNNLWGYKIKGVITQQIKPPDSLNNKLYCSGHIMFACFADIMPVLFSCECRTCKRVILMCGVTSLWMSTFSTNVTLLIPFPVFSYIKTIHEFLSMIKVWNLEGKGWRSPCLLVIKSLLYDWYCSMNYQRGLNQWYLMSIYQVTFRGKVEAGSKYKQQNKISQKHLKTFLTLNLFAKYLILSWIFDLFLKF